MISVVQRALREEWGVPEPPRAVRGLPTTADEIRAYVAGERLLGPCGLVVGECVAVSGGVRVAGGLGFCSGCGVRVV